MAFKVAKVGEHIAAARHHGARACDTPGCMQAILAVTIPFFALVVAGYLAAWRGVLPDSAIPGLNAFVLYFALPCMLFRFGMNTPVFEVLTRRCWWFISACALLMVFLAIALTLAARVHLKDAAFGALVAAFPNTGFMGVPMLVALIGPAAAGPMISTIWWTCSSPPRVLRIALAQVARRRRPRRPQGLGAGAARRAEQPAALVDRAGRAFSVAGVKLPAPPDVVVRMLADAASPVALFTIGAVLWRAGRHVHTQTPVRLYLPLALMKLLLHPLLVFVVALAAGALGLPLTGLQITADLDRRAAQRQQRGAAGRALRRRQRPSDTHHHGQHGAGVRQLLAARLGSSSRVNPGRQSAVSLGTLYTESKTSTPP